MPGRRAAQGARLHGVSQAGRGQRGARLGHAAGAGLQQRERAQAQHRHQLAQVPPRRRAAQPLVSALRRRHLRGRAVPLGLGFRFKDRGLLGFIANANFRMKI